MDRRGPSDGDGGTRGVDLVRASAHAPAVRRASFFIATVLVSALPFVACDEDFSGGGGLPGDIPRAEGDSAPSDGGLDRNDARETDAFVVKDVGIDTADTATTD